MHHSFYNQSIHRDCIGFKRLALDMKIPHPGEGMAHSPVRVGPTLTGQPVVMIGRKQGRGSAASLLYSEQKNVRFPTLETSRFFVRLYGLIPPLHRANPWQV